MKVNGRKPRRNRGKKRAKESPSVAPAAEAQPAEPAAASETAPAFGSEAAAGSGEPASVKPPAPEAAPTPVGGTPAASWVERRASVRHEIEVNVDLDSDDNFYTGLTQDISAGGLFIATRKPHQVGESAHVKFTLPGQSEPIEAFTEVRWVRDRPAIGDDVVGVGLKFLELSAENKAAITAFFETRESIFYDDE